MKTFIHSLSVIALVALVSGCKKVERIDVQPPTVSATEAGKQIPLKASGLTADGQPLPDTKFTFASSDDKIAKVDATGIVTVVKSGSATITVSGAEKTAKVPVEAVIPAAITVKGSPVTLTGLGSTATLEAQVQDDADRPVQGAQVEFVSADPKIVEVSGTTLTAKAPGATQVTATSGALKQNIDVTVKLPEVASVAFDAAPANVKVGESVQLTVLAKTAEGANIEGVTHAFASSNEKIATVDATGKVTGVKPGVATITVKNGEKTAETKLTVKK
ncbi:Ig-like domain-containing protein [Hyalangium rubrum]|uniref:Ig-like domain-containing protein n=1 Tax=Hyalangium rubrum TaxID=3103134 RepID=A0ABU5HDW3_9BACT|nr:Ig-like domain-containing protein [Hyalangium sp. s54d21]MDY7231665.1 Ig-like domain-containing protein [Hyalangium sp. s54d21]